MADWQAQSIRLTAFPTPDALTRSHDWWQSVTDIRPDEATSNPKKGSTVIRGLVGSQNLVLRLEEERIDWLLTPSDGENDELSVHREIPSLGPAITAIDDFSTIIEKWFGLADLPAFGRIAFGAVLLHPLESRRDGYTRLSDYVPVRIDPASTDFLYQINLPPTLSRTKIEDLRLNRLSKWNVISWRPVAFRFNGEEIQAQRSPEGFTLRVELDINTAPDFAGAIPQARLIEIFRELKTLGLGIASDGVIGQ